MLIGAKRSSGSFAARLQGDSSPEQELMENIMPSAKMPRVGHCTPQPAETAQAAHTALPLQASTMLSDSGHEQIRKKQVLLELILLMRAVNAYSWSFDQTVDLDDVLQAASASLTAGTRAMHLAAALMAADSSTHAAETAINVAEAALAATFSKIQLARQTTVQVLAQQQQQVDDDLEDTDSSSCCTTVALQF